MVPEGPRLWLLASNLLFVAGGVAAYATRIDLALVTCFALVAAMPGLWEWRTSGDVHVDKAASYAAGTWAVAAVLILLPYVTIDQNASLWASQAYTVLGLVAASLGMLLWNLAAHRAQHDNYAASRAFALFHVAAIAVAVWLVLQGDGETVAITVRGFETTTLDLRTAPAVAAMPGLVWAGTMRQKEPSR